MPLLPIHAYQLASKSAPSAPIQTRVSDPGRSIPVRFKPIPHCRSASSGSLPTARILANPAIPLQTSALLCFSVRTFPQLPILSNPTLYLPLHSLAAVALQAAPMPSTPTHAEPHLPDRSFPMRAVALHAYPNLPFPNSHLRSLPDLFTPFLTCHSFPNPCIAFPCKPWRSNPAIPYLP